MKKYDRGYDTPSDHNPQNRATSSKKQMETTKDDECVNPVDLDFEDVLFFLLDRLADPVLSCPKFWCSGFRYTGLICAVSWILKSICRRKLNNWGVFTAVS